MLLFIDFETAYDKESGYYMGTKALSLYEYVRDERFKVLGLAVAKDNFEKISWISGRDADVLRNAFNWPNIDVVAHNAKFDCYILKHHYGITPRSYIDTLSMSRAVIGRQIKDHSLKTVAEYLGLPPKLDSLKDFDGKFTLTEEEERNLAEYCIRDTEICREIYKKLEPEFPKSQYSLMSWTVETFVTPQLVLDVPMLEKAAEDEAKEKKDKFESLGVPGETFRSTAKFAALLKSKGFKVPTKANKKGRDIPALAKGDTAFLDMLSSDDDKLRLLCEAREAAKSTLVETRAGRLARIGRTGPFAFDLAFSGAMNTHRFSGEGGTNSQNFRKCKDPVEHEKEGHKCPGILLYAIGAKEGHSLVSGDAAQIEARFVAYLSGDPGLIDEIENRPDIYCDYGSAFYGRTITKADKIERQFSKTAKLSLQYGTGYVKFQTTCKTQAKLDVSEEDCKKAVQLYRNKYTRVPALWRDLENYIPKMTTGETGRVGWMPLTYGKEYIGLPSGLKIRYPNLRQEDGDRGRKEWVYDTWKNRRIEKQKLYGAKMLEGICQALTGEHIKTVMEEFKETMVGQEHDAIFLSVPTHLAPVYAKKLDRALSIPPKWMPPKMKLAAETGIGKTLADCK